MKHKLRATCTVLFYLLASGEGLEINSWRSMDSPNEMFNQYQEAQREMPQRKPSEVIRPVMAKIGMRTSMPSHVQEYPVSPRRSGNRVIVAKTQPAQIMRNIEIPEMEKSGNVMGNKDSSLQVVPVPIPKVDILNRTMLAPLQRMDIMKEGTLQRVQLPAGYIEDSNSEVSTSPLQKAESEKQTASEMIMVAGMNLEDLKNNIVGMLTEKFDEVKNIAMGGATEPIEKVNELRSVLITSFLQKLENLKNEVPMLPGMNFDEMKDAIDRILSQKVEEVKNMALDLAMNPLAKVEDLKAGLVASPLEKAEALKSIVPGMAMLPGMNGLKNGTESVLMQTLEEVKDMPTNPMQKAEDIASPLEKVEDLKDAVPGTAMLPEMNLEDLKGGIVRILTQQIEDGKKLALDGAVDPVGKADDLRNEFIANFMQKLDAMKNLLPGMKTLPEINSDVLKNNIGRVLTEKVEEVMKMALDGTILNPVEKANEVISNLMRLPQNLLNTVKEPVMEEIIPSMGAASDLKESVANLPMADTAKDAIAEKAVQPLEVAAEVKENVQLPLQNITDIKDVVTDKMPMNNVPVKLESALEPKQELKDVVFNAFQQSIVGDRKEYFKQALGSMSKEELEDFHEILIQVISMKGFLPPVVGNVKEDLKEAVHELAMTGGDNMKKDSLIEIEHVLEPMSSTLIQSKDEVLTKPIETAKTPLENVSEPIQNSSSMVSNAENVMGRMQNMGRKRRWVEFPSRETQISYNRYRQSSGQVLSRVKRSIYGVGTPAQELHSFPPPARLRMPLKTAFRQINSAAPPDPYPKSKESLNLPLLSINERATDKILMDIKEGLQYVLQTRNDWTFAVHGTGTTGCHAVLDNLIESGDTVLVLINGYWGELMANMSERLGAQVVRYNSKPGTVFSLSEIEAALLSHRPDLVLIVQGESSTGVNQPLDGIGDLCAKNGALLVADAVAVAGMQPVLMDKNKIDAVFTSSHKGLGGVVGLAPVSLSSRAVEKLESRLTPPRAYQTDLKLQKQLWNTNDPDRVRFQSSSLPLLYGLREALATIVEERMEKTFQRHALTSEFLNRGLSALGLEHFVENPKDRLIGITAVKAPIGKDPKKIANFMFKNYNVEISSGFGPTEGKVLRFATFATNADTLRVSNLLRALKNALNSRETSTSY